MTEPVPIHEESFLRVLDICKRLSVKTQTVRKWIKDGDLQAVTLDGIQGYRISMTEYKRFLNERYGPKQ